HRAANHQRHRDSQGTADMSRYENNDAYSQAGDWALGAARRNPEALLLLAAGLCLLMRRGNSASRTFSHTRYDDTGHEHRPDSLRGDRAPPGMREGLLRAADSVADYAAQVKDRVSDTASSYAQSGSEFTEDARRNVSERSARLTRQAQSTLQSSVNRIL